MSMTQLSVWLWAGALVIGVFAAHWGAERFAEPLKKLRQQWGLTAVAGGAFVGLAAASPEIGISIVSAFRGVSDIGLGVMFGANIVAIPLMVTTAYLASRTKSLGNAESNEGGEPSQRTQPSFRQTESSTHERHRQEHLLHVDRTAVTVLALPYLGILALVTVLTLPAPWRGLQPFDAAVMAVAYLIFLGQAVVRGRQERESVDWERREIGMAGAGIAVLAIGTYLSVRATENIVAALGISRLVGGLFITAIMAASPEVFATWSVVRSGQPTAGTTSVLGDHAVTMSVAFVPLALVTVPVENFQLYVVNLAFVSVMPAAYAVLLHFGSAEHGFKRWEVTALGGIYVLYVVIVAFWVLNVL
jgi:cation:H+ antiporter